LKAYPHTELVLNRDDAFYDYWYGLAGTRHSISFGFSEQADVRALAIDSSLTPQGYQTRFTVDAGGFGAMKCCLHLAGEHNVKNALAAMAVALQLGLPLADIVHALEHVRPVTGRMQPLQGKKGNVVIDDTYNANPSSLQVALDALQAEDENWVVLGAFGELGPDSEAIHAEMGQTIRQMPVKRLFATGDLARHTVSAFGCGGEFFATQEQLIAALNQAVTGKETILVKGSRSQKMENVVASLVDNFRAA